TPPHKGPEPPERTVPHRPHARAEDLELAGLLAVLADAEHRHVPVPDIRPRLSGSVGSACPGRTATEARKERPISTTDGACPPPRGARAVRSTYRGSYAARSTRDSPGADPSAIMRPVKPVATSVERYRPSNRPSSSKPSPSSQDSTMSSAPILVGETPSVSGRAVSIRSVAGVPGHGTEPSSCRRPPIPTSARTLPSSKTSSYQWRSSIR